MQNMYRFIDIKYDGSFLKNEKEFPARVSVALRFRRIIATCRQTDRQTDSRLDNATDSEATAAAFWSGG